jgi:hypothetical protein
MFKYTIFQEQFDYLYVILQNVSWKGVFPMCKNLILV